MFDFEKLKVYQKANDFNKTLRTQLLIDPLEKTSEYQLKRSALSIVLNIAEGSGRFSKLDKRRFYITARGSLFEVIAILKLAFEEQSIAQNQYEQLYSLAEELSKMLYVMIRNLGE